MSETPEATAGNTGEAEPETGLTVSKDTLEGAVAPSVPLRPTFTDASGVERIAGPPVSNWEPAPVEPSEEQIARMDEHNAREAERRDARLNALTDSERLGDTAQPLVDANKAYADELDGAGGVTDVTPTDPTATGDPTTSVTSPDPNVGSTTGTTTPPAAPSGQTAVETDATAAADADVAAQVEAARAAQAQQTATTADQTLRDAEAAEVANEEGQA